MIYNLGNILKPERNQIVSVHAMHMAVLYFILDCIYHYLLVQFTLKNLRIWQKFQVQPREPTIVHV